MKFPFRKRSEFDDLLTPRRKFPSRLAWLVIFVFVIALVWYLLFKRGGEMPSPPARPRVAAPEPNAEPPPPETLPKIPETPKAVARPRVSPAPESAPEKPDGGGEDENRR
jgi:hypothetical protein